MKGLRTIGAIALLLAAAGGALAQERKPDEIYSVRADDPEMNAARARARSELPEFYRRMANPAPNERNFAIKYDILPGERAEYVWAIDLDRSTTPMTGTLQSQPEFTDHQAGQRVTIPEADIVDWAYFRDNVMQGNYSDRLALSRMPPEEAARIRRELGW